MYINYIIEINLNSEMYIAFLYIFECINRWDKEISII